MTVSCAKLVRMAEQIAANITVSTDAEVIAAKLADHIQRFWDPRMRQAIISHAQSGSDISPVLRLAIDKIRG